MNVLCRNFILSDFCQICSSFFCFFRALSVGTPTFIIEPTYLTAWNTIPPKEPLPLFPYIGAVLRNHAFNRYSYNHAAKRSCSCREIESEIESLSCGDDIGDSIDYGIITECINRLLRAADEVNRMLFVRRYWYCDGLSELSRRSGLSENVIKSRLKRMREKLRADLEKEGITV